jgi:hypothetical protein
MKDKDKISKSDLLKRIEALEKSILRISGISDESISIDIDIREYSDKPVNPQPQRKIVFDYTIGKDGTINDISKMRKHYTYDIVEELITEMTTDLVYFKARNNNWAKGEYLVFIGHYE